MVPLPVDAVIADLVGALRTAGAAIVVAPPGSGKSTRIAPGLLAAHLLAPEHPALVMLQPRRVAARAVAQRIAQEQRWTLGHEVGYHVRFDRRVGRETRLRVLTEGILTRQLLADPFLEGVGAVLLDEFHERNLHSDLALAWLREIRLTVRPDLRVLVMSATLDPQPVAAFLGGCPVLRVDTPTHPVAIGYSPARQARQAIAEQAANAVIGLVEAEPAGPVGRSDILVFLPGASEIRGTGRLLGPLAQRHALEVLPLYSSLPAVEQDRALRPAPNRKVILSTNIAETSLTIEGVSTVIDTGLARFARTDPDRGIERLELGRISRAAADQRAGRAGRLGPGRCLRLWSEREHQRRPAYEAPEIQRIDLAAPLLAIHAWGCRQPEQFGWFEAPPVEAIGAAQRLLTMLGALEDGQITPLGRALLELPVHPRVARMLLAASAWGVEELGIACAALIEAKDVLVVGRAFSAASTHSGGPSWPVAASRSDLDDRLEMVQFAERQRFSPRLIEAGIDVAAARQVVLAQADLTRVLGRVRGRSGLPVPACPVAEPGREAIEILPLLAYPDRVCRRRAHDPLSGVMVGGRGVRLDPSSRVRQGELFLAIRLRDDSRRARSRGEARVQIAGAIEPEWLAALAPDAVTEDRVVRFDRERGRAIAVAMTRYFDLPIREATHGAVDAETASASLAGALADEAETIVRSDAEAARWLDRLDFLRGQVASLPEFGAEALTEILNQACIGVATVKELRARPMVPYLLARLGRSTVRTLEELAPESLVVPSGSRIPIRYEAGQPPTLAVRVQELFGWHDTPRIAGGRFPLLLHILAPNQQPVQVTSDLRSFWTTTYLQVRKDLRGRYPKHHWPEDPWTARPASRPRRPGGS